MSTTWVFGDRALPKNLLPISYIALYGEREVAMKNKIFPVSMTIACTLMLIYVTVQLFRIDDKMSQIARPARLFNPKLIESHFPPRKEWEVKVSSDRERFFSTVCQQTLTWLGRGMQAVVFETQDEKYVVKFFQLGRLRENLDRGFVQNLFSQETKEKRQERLAHREEIFSSSKMCFEELQDETGIVYVHLNRTKDKVQGIKLVDKYGQSHRIRGDDSSFVVQKKAKYLIPTINKLMEHGKVEETQARVNQVFELLISLARKGFADGDDALIRNNNIGLAEDRAIYIDTGHLFRAPNLDVAERMRYEFQVRLDPLEKWLNIAYPEIGAYYRERRNEILAALDAEKAAHAQQPAQG